MGGHVVVQDRKRPTPDAATTTRGHHLTEHGNRRPEALVNSGVQPRQRLSPVTGPLQNQKDDDADGEEGRGVLLTPTRPPTHPRASRVTGTNDQGSDDKTTRRMAHASVSYRLKAKIQKDSTTHSLLQQHSALEVICT